MKIDSIEKIEVNKKSIKLIFNDGSRSRTFCMRKWPKKYFINALALNSSFKGEVVLTDNFIHVDYYEMYYADK